MEGNGSIPRTLAFSFEAGDPVSVNLRPDGSFQMAVPRGQRIAVAAGSLPAGYSLASLTNDLRVILRATTPAVKVSGRVARCAALPLESRVWLTDTAGIFQPLETALASDGTFAFAGVAPGAYTARVSARGIPATAAVTSVPVGGSDVANVEILAPREVRGRVVISNNVDAAPRFSLPLVGISGTADSALTIDVRGDGTFTVFLPVGERRVGPPAGLPSGYAMESLTYGGTDLLRDPLNVLPTDSSELQIRLTVTPAAGDPK
jgi:hypothetical protein